MARIATLNFHWDTTNFGAVLTAYALNRLLAGMGHDVKSLDFKPDLPRVRKKPANPEFDRFRRENIPTTDPVRTPADFRLVNSEYDAFVVGSDQVWNPHIAGWYPDSYFLSFVNPGKRRISAAASFGCVPTERYSRDYLRASLGAFDALSVREEAAAADLRRIGINPTVLPDPVFGLDREEWRKLGDRSGIPYDGSEVVWYSVNRSELPKFDKFFEDHAGALSGRIRHLEAQAGIENWIKGISRASLVVTDSFHATCFAVLFGKPFVVFIPGDAKAERMKGLLRRLHIPGRIYTRNEELPSLGELMKPIDYRIAESELAKMRDELHGFFSAALSSPLGEAVERKRRCQVARTGMRSRVVRRLFLLAGYLALQAAKFALLRPFAPGKAAAVKRVFRARREEFRGWKGILARLRGYADDASRPHFSKSLAAYALMASDGVRAESTSGGAFTVMAAGFIADGGLVAGAAFDGRFNCRYELVSDEAGLERLRKTKYVKAELTREFFREMKSALASGKRVLFFGIPCQVAAVAKCFKRFRDQLTLVDLICAGAPAQRYFRRYLDENWGVENVLSYDFRSKAQGWRHRHNLIRILLKDGSEIFRTKAQDEFRQAMGLRFTQDDGCFRCPFAGPERPGDLTIGDFWGAPTACDDAKGTSAVLVNTERGRDLVGSLTSGSLRLLREIDPELVFVMQPALRAPAGRVNGRDVFLRELERCTLKESLAKAGKA